MDEKTMKAEREQLYETFCNGDKGSFSEALEKIIKNQPDYYEKVKTNMLHSAAWIRLNEIFKYLVQLQEISQEEETKIWERFE